MNYDDMLNKAINENCLEKLLCGSKPFEVEVSMFTSDVFPTDINAILVNCFYKKKHEIEDIDERFITSLFNMIDSEASKLYIAILYFDACIFHEERGTATFKIDKEKIAKKIRSSICNKRNELLAQIEFENGMKKINPMKNVSNFNKYYVKKYGISII